MIYPTTKSQHSHPFIQLVDIMLGMQLIEIQKYEIGRNSPDKTTWWKVDLCRVYNIYSIDILFKNYDGFGMFFVLR